MGKLADDAAGAAQVIACEWNPNAVEALRKNLQLNGVADRCQVLEGDCTLTAPKVGDAGLSLLRLYDA